MLRKCQSLLVSEQVVVQLQNNTECLSWLDGVDGYFECYQNGREQGHVLRGLSKGNKLAPMDCCFYICQHRGSDSIVVYKGRPSMSSIDEDAYKNPTYFDQGDYIQCAKWIAKTIQTLFK